MDEGRMVERFWAKVDKNGPIVRPELGPCWIWTASLFENGYGVFNIAGKITQAHRVAFMLDRGWWPTPCGLHHCDNRACVRPDHIFEGSKADNNRDRANKGRNGSNSDWFKTPEGQAQRARILELARSPQARAKREGALNGTHTHPESRRIGESHGMSKVTEAMVVEMRAMRAQGLAYRIIGERFGLKVPQVHRICERKSWAHVP